MKTFSRIRQWLSNKTGRIGNFSLALLIAGTAALYLLLLFFARELAGAASFLSVGFSWIWFLLPGLLLSFIFAQNISWWERIPIGFVLSIGLTTPVTVFAILRHLSLNAFIALHAAGLITAAVLLIIQKFVKIPKEYPASSSENNQKGKPELITMLLFIILIILVGLLAFHALQWPITGDDTAILPLYGDVLNQDRITGVEPFHGSGVQVTPRNELIVATYLQILTDKISGASPQEFIVNSRPYLVILAFLALAVLLNQFLKDRRQSLFLLCLWGVYLLATMQADQTGSDFITRIIQDKFLGWFIIVPTALVFVSWFLEQNDWGKVIGFGVITLGASMVHPITLIQIMILVASFGLLHLAVKRTKETFFNLVFLALVLLLCTLIPFFQYIRFTNYMPVDLAGLGEAVEFGRLSASINRYRLWLLDNGQFILHPSIALKPIVIAGYLMLPLIVWKMRRNHLAQLIIGAMILLPVLLYVPFFAALAGKAVTPYLLWRLAWPFPLLAVLSIGSVFWLIAGKLTEKLAQRGKRRLISTYFSPMLILLVILAAAPAITQSFSDYSERRSEVYRSTCIKAGEALSFLDKQTTENPANVLSSHLLNLCIPGYAPNANVVEFRGYGTINRLSYDNVEDSIQRVKDVDYFKTARLVDDLIVQSLAQHETDYIFIEKDNLDLDLQLNFLPEYFDLVYEDNHFRLYSVADKEINSPVVAGNTALRLKQFNTAKEIFSEVLVSQPQNILAHIGIGLAEEGLGNSSQTINAYQQAIQYQPDEPALHALLASAYMLNRAFDQSAQEYQAAIALSAERADLHKALGEVYVLLGQFDNALASFEQFASIKAIDGSASYYSLLGRSLRDVESLRDQAIDYQEAAISIQPDPEKYIDLSRTWIIAGETEKAVDQLETAIRLDRWSFLPHLELGYIHWNRGELDTAIQEFETACRLNPANVTAYIMLGMAINDQNGIEAAMERLQSLQSMNSVLPGPYRTYAILMAARGQYDQAMQLLDRSAAIQPNSASVLTSKGYISITAGQLTTALESFEQALFSYPDLVSARLGLGMYYNLEANYQLEAGQFLQIVQIVPTAAWIHEMLAGMYTQNGDYLNALDEINWAIKLDSDNPEIYIARGDINGMQSKWPLAMADYNIALDLDPQNATALVQLGKIYQREENYTEAEKSYRLAREYQPDSVLPVVQLANLYWQTGRIDEAQELEAAAFDMEPDSNLVLISLAESYEKQGKIEEAKSIYEQVIQTFPKSVAAHIALAQLLEEDNNLTELFSVYDNFLQDNPDSAKAYLAVGEFLVEQAQYDLAEQGLTAALSFNDVSVDNYIALKDLQLRRGEWDAALQTLEAAVKIFPGEAKAYLGLGEYYLVKGQYKAAAGYFDDAIELEPGMMAGYAGKSQVERISGSLTQAEQILQNAVQESPASAEAFLALAAFQESIQKIEAAEINIHEALAINPSDTNTIVTAGKFYIRQQKYSQALEQLEAALDLPGSKLEIYLQLGRLEFARGQTGDAVDWFEQAKLENQSDERPYLSLAEIYKAGRNYGQAQEELLTAMQFKPANIEVLLSLGDLSIRLGDADTASSYFESAVQLNQNNITPLLTLSNLYKKQENWVEAVNLLERAIRIDATNFNAYLSLAQIEQVTGNCTEIKSTVTTGLLNTPDKQNGLLSAAQVFENCGLWDDAQEFYELAWNEESNPAASGLALADFLLKRNHKTEALAALQAIESRVGLNAQTSVAFGNTYASQANWKNAEEAYQQAIRLDPNHQDGYLGLANIYELQGNLEDALALYQNAADQFPNSIEVQVALGNVLMKRESFEEAQAAFKKALEIDPYNYSGISNDLELSLILDQAETELAVYVNDALAAPTSRAYLTVAQLHQLHGDNSQAHAWFQKAIQLNPQNSDSWLQLGNDFRRMGQWEASLESYRSALKYNPGSNDILIAMGNVQEELGSDDEAGQSYIQAIHANPGEIAGYIALANLQLSLGNTEEAIRTLQEGIAQVPGDYRGYEALGDLYAFIEPENIDQAVSAYQSGIAIVPGSPHLYVKIANINYNIVSDFWEKLEQAAEYETAAENRYHVYLNQFDFGEGSSLRPRFFQRRVDQLIQIYEARQEELRAAQYRYDQISDNYTMAETNYTMALSLDQNDVAALIGLGRLRLANGLTSEGAALYEKAVAVNPFSSAALINLGNYYTEIGAVDKAADLFETVIEREPTNAIANNALSIAYHEAVTLSVSRAARSVEQSSARIETLITGIREKR